MKKSDRIIVFNKYGGKCAYTGKDLGDDWQIDHVTPKRYYLHFMVQGRANDIDNLLPAIKIVNHYKRALDLEGFRRYMMKFHTRLSKLPKNTRVKETENRKKYMFMVAELFDITPNKPFLGKFYFENPELLK